MLSLGDIPAVAIMVVIGVITLGVGANIIGSMTTQFTTPTIENNTYYALTNGSSLLRNLFTNLPVVGIVVAGAIVIGVLISVFPTGGRGI